MSRTWYTGSPALVVLINTAEKEETGSGSPSDALEQGEGGTLEEKAFEQLFTTVPRPFFSNG